MVKCCVSAALSDLGQIRDLLSLARETIQKDAGKEEINVELMGTVSKMMQRMETFRLLHPEGDVDTWIPFSRADLLSEFQRFLSGGHLKETLLLWTRHKPEFSLGLDEDLIEQLLEIIPSKMWDIETKLQWLRVFLPDCLHLVPESLPLISQWTMTQARSYELRMPRREWPENGLEFATAVLETLCFSSSSSDQSLEASSSTSGGDCSLKAVRAQLVLSQQRNSKDSELSRLIKLIDDLKDLKVD